MDLQGDTAFIELNDKGIDPITLDEIPSLTNSEFIDISNLIEKKKEVNFEYVKASTIHMKHKVVSNSTYENKKVLPFQEIGSIPIKLNSYDRGVEVFDSYFNVIMDYYEAFVYGISDSIDQWDNAVSIMLTEDGYGETKSITYTNQDTTTTSLDALITWSKPIRFAISASYLFKETLALKRNNKIVEVSLYDRLGTLMTFRKDYKIDNQIYKLIAFDFNPSTKECLAQLILK